jgi:protein-tyrosine phosphatase
MQQPTACSKTVLFLCTGNYYRSRFAELYFNARAEARDLPWRADSRGLQLWPENIGPISRHTVRRLAAHRIALPKAHRDPLALAEEDLQRAHLVIAVKEAEHRPLLQRYFPSWCERVEYWHVHDIEDALPDEALTELTQQVEDLLARLPLG